MASEVLAAGCGLLFPTGFGSAPSESLSSTLECRLSVSQTITDRLSNNVDLLVSGFGQIYLTVTYMSTLATALPQPMPSVRDDVVYWYLLQ